MANNMNQDLLEIDGWSDWATDFDDRRLLDFVDKGFDNPVSGPVKISLRRCVRVVWGPSAQLSRH